MDAVIQDAVARHERYPLSFPIASETRRRAVTIDDIVKVNVEPTNGAGHCSIWLSIVDVQAERRPNGKRTYTAHIATLPAHCAWARLEEAVTIEPRHIVDVYDIATQEPPA